MTKIEQMVMKKQQIRGNYSHLGIEPNWGLDSSPGGLSPVNPNSYMTFHGREKQRQRAEIVIKFL